MQVRTGWVAVLSASIVVTLVGAGGCARKSVDSRLSAAEPRVTAPPREVPSTPPTSTPASAPSAVEELSPVFFRYDSQALDDAARSVLDRHAKVLRDKPDVRLTIEGHCDERGTVEYNMSLGERRAQAARDYLVAAGVASHRIETISYGRERPFDDGHDEGAWSANRRAHFVVR